MLKKEVKLSNRYLALKLLSIIKTDIISLKLKAIAVKEPIKIINNLGYKNFIKETFNNIFKKLRSTGNNI
jgi:hypothetical protein